MSLERPGCVLGKFGGWDLCNVIERPLHHFFHGPYNHLLRYSHKDSVEWDGSDCEKLRDEIRALIRKREAGYPFRANHEVLWILPERDPSGKFRWDVAKCNVRDLGTIISAETETPIQYKLEPRYDIALSTVSIEYWASNHMGLWMRNPDVVVEIHSCKDLKV